MLERYDQYQIKKIVRPPRLEHAASCLEGFDGQIPKNIHTQNHTIFTDVLCPDLEGRIYNTAL
jgi:hypothetical protein